MEKYIGIVTHVISRFLPMESSTGVIAPKGYPFPHGLEPRGPLLRPPRPTAGCEQCVLDNHVRVWEFGSHEIISLWSDAPWVFWVKVWSLVGTRFSHRLNHGPVAKGTRDHRLPFGHRGMPFLPGTVPILAVLAPVSSVLSGPR